MNMIDCSVKQFVNTLSIGACTKVSQLFVILYCVCTLMQNYHLCSKTGSGGRYYREAIISIPKSQNTNPQKNSDHT